MASRIDGRQAGSGYGKAIAPPTRRHVPGEPGIWVFVLGDLLLFSCFFVAFAYQRHHHLASFHSGQQSLNLTIGTINTVLLLTSSLFVALATTMIRTGSITKGRALLLPAFACGLVFVCVKVVEYTRLAGVAYQAETNDFFGYYFVLTGIHLVHVITGLAFLAAIWLWTSKPRVLPDETRLIEGSATYWHLVDLLWIVLFSLLYLSN
ncbi:cytochrome c oxidase subunit 3 family protein [Streptomyces sp. TG1A-8]|uniref:cytochrome c oxidase subunit 3 family protein n=1 Tax=Streptomyces sp. TG1A-8 TaxID=3051385 RepID=UPI00265C3CA2|nr:cytochrome c oxidase subunit 3 family protein [Streptomyces sp. TG1A-8]MDO0929013.1 cytochrome c oxidase subunit 3 family protein [Streptomyces sp. TG1A-8]